MLYFNMLFRTKEYLFSWRNQLKESELSVHKLEKNLSEHEEERNLLQIIHLYGQNNLNPIQIHQPIRKSW